MTNIVALNRQAHRDLRVKPIAAAPRNFVAVVVSEFSHLVAHYPILISKDSDTGAFYCGAMLGIDEGENLFAADREIYRPLNLQRGPFFAAGTDLAIDLDGAAIGGGERLFGDDGDPTPYLKSIMALFRDLKPGLEQTRVFLAVLAERNLIAPLAVELSFDDGSSRTLDGLYTIDAEALRRLPDSEVVLMFRRGYLELCHLMLASLRQVPVLASRKNAGLRGGAALAGAFA